MTISKLLANEDFTREFFEMPPRKNVRELQERLESQEKTIKEHQEQNGHLKNQLSDLEYRNANQIKSIQYFQKFEAQVREIFGIPFNYAGAYDQIIGMLKFKKDVDKKSLEATINCLATVVGMDPTEYSSRDELLHELAQEMAALYEIKQTLVGAYDKIIGIANR